MEREQPYLGDLLTMVINHLLTGMILQVTVNNISVPMKISGFLKSVREIGLSLSHFGLLGSEFMFFQGICKYVI